MRQQHYDRRNTMDHSLKVTITEAGKEGFLSLVGDLTMAEAQETKKVLLEAIQEVNTLHLDLKEIESVDLSFIQLLCAAHRECFLAEKAIFLQGDVSDIMEKLLEKAGYSKQFGCSSAAKKSCLWSSFNNDHQP
jgi:anti-anti-sigma factor